MRLRAAILALLALFVGAPAAAEPIGITVLGSTFTTGVRITEFASGFSGPLLPPVSRETVSSDPITDSMLVPVTPNPNFPSLPSTVGAIADTGFFSVHAETTSYTFLTPLWASESLAKSEIVFTPVIDSSGELRISLTTSGHSDYWSEGTVSLFDLTANTRVWKHGWDFPFHLERGDLNGFDTPLHLSPLYLADILVDSTFDASHQYLLTIATFTQSQNDRQGITLEVSGLHVVPEPTTALLLTMGVGALAEISRHRRRVRRPA